MYNEILEYQNVESKILEIERVIATSEERKKVSRARNILNDFETSKNAMDKKAETLNNNFAKLKEKSNVLSKELEEYKSVLEKSKGEEEINYFIRKMGQLEDSIDKCEKEMSDLIASVKELLVAFDDIRNKAKQAKADFEEGKVIYDKFKEERRPEIDKIKKELAELEKSIDSKLLEAYKKVRAKKIFPAIVGLNGNMCAGCRMELSLNKISDLDTKGIAECEECGRIIYKS